MRIIFFLSLVVMMACNNNKKVATKTDVTPTTPTVVAKPQPAVKATPTNDKTIQFNVKIIRVSCASVVAMITDEAMQDKGESWAPHNVRMAKPYKGVFTIANICDFKNVKEGDSFLAKVIAATDSKSQCIVCAMEDFPPATKHSLKMIGEAKSEN
jgi:hypothetical protein